MSDNPMVALNRAIAASMVHGPAAGRTQLDELVADARIATHYRLDAARAHLYERAGDITKAAAHFRAAAERTASVAERNYLLAKASLGHSRSADTRCQPISTDPQTSRSPALLPLPKIV